MIDLGWIQKLDHGNIPNVDANLSAACRAPGWDPKRDYSVPWQSGFTGIAYNAKYTGEVEEPEGADHPLRPQGQGQHAHRDARHDGLHAQASSAPTRPTSPTTSWARRSTSSKKAVAAGQFRRFTGNDYVDDLNAGNIVACEAWSGDVIAMQYDNPDIKWVVPGGGPGASGRTTCWCRTRPTTRPTPRR